MSLAKAIIDAVKENDIELIENLLNERAPVNCVDEAGYSPLHWAAMYNRSEAAHALLVNGVEPCNLDAEDRDGYTPLHLAIRQGRLPLMRLLLTYGADVTKKTKGGRTAIQLASIQGQSDVIEVLQNSAKKQEQQVVEISEEWKLGKLLGSGAFGKVFLAVDPESNLHFAVKRIETNGRNASMGRELSALDAEIQVLRNLRHERIVQYYGMAKEAKCMYIFMEYMPGGSMHELVTKERGLPEKMVAIYTRQILEGIDYLHGKMIVHRDIKGANILLSQDMMQVKLSDFGLSKRLQRCSTMSGLKSVLGSPYWMAPEVVKASQFKGEGYGRKADIWSFGCTVYEMLTSLPPWYEMEPMTAMYNIGSGQRPPQIPEHTSIALTDFLHQTLNRDARARPSAQDLLLHPFLTTERQQTNSLVPEAIRGKSGLSEAIDPLLTLLRRVCTETVLVKIACNVVITGCIGFLVMSLTSWRRD